MSTLREAVIIVIPRCLPLRSFAFTWKGTCPMSNVLPYVGFAVVLVVIIALVVWYIKKANAKYTQLWGALAGPINGTAKGNSLTGTYQNMPVTAKITATNNDNSNTYFYNLEAKPGSQGQDWSVSYTGDKMLGLGAKAWRIKAKDDALAQRLEAAGAVAALQPFTNYPTITYKAKAGTLTYNTQVRNAYAVPSPDEFQQQLALLQQLAQIQQQVNLV